MESKRAVPQKGVITRAERRKLIKEEYQSVLPYLDGFMGALSEVDKVKVAKDLKEAIVGKDKPMSDFAIFAMYCKELGANPLKKEIWCTYMWDSSLGRVAITPITSIHFLRDRARDSHNPTYAYTREAGVEFDAEGSPISATMSTYGFFDQDKKIQEISRYTAYYSECVHRKKDGSPNQRWAIAPIMMLKKCAEAQALRQGFRLSTIYISEEVESVRGEAVTEAEVIND